MEKRIGHLIIHETIFCFWQFSNNVLILLLCKICVFDIFNVVDFFEIFVILRGTEILYQTFGWECKRKASLKEFFLKVQIFF